MPDSHRSGQWWGDGDEGKNLTFSNRLPRISNTDGVEIAADELTLQAKKMVIDGLFKIYIYFLLCFC